MAIPNSQLEIWSHQGSVAQSAQTYDTIKEVLNDTASPYSGKDFSVFLQGSYGNNTNVYQDSDVDIVICLDQTYYSDIYALTEVSKNNLKNSFRLATYSYFDFRVDVLKWLKNNFGTEAINGKKAVLIESNGSRRSADILICAQHRRYRASSNGLDSQYDEGVCFWSGDGVKIVNFPKQHAENCIDKHKDTNHWFKPTVRVFKNMRNRMIDDEYILDGIAPSYFIEGLLWNAPSALFGGSYEDSVVNIFNWLLGVKKEKFACANDLFWLVREASPNCWETDNFDAYLLAVKKYWDDWG